MRKIENMLMSILAEYILATRFRSKHALADALHVPYRILLKVCAENGNAQSTEIVTCRIMRYCVEYRIRAHSKKRCGAARADKE